MKKVQKKKKTFAIKPEDFQTGKGIKQLYNLTKQVKWEDPMTT